MKKLIYPMSYDCRELLNSYGLLETEENLIFVVKDNTKMYYQRLAELYDMANVSISEDFVDSMLQAESIILVEGGELSDYLEKLEIANKHDKKVYATLAVFKLLSKNQIDSKVLLLEERKEIGKNDDDELLEINVPVIGVMGIGKYCDKFMCELYLRSYYTNLGYKVLQFGSKDISPILGFESLPEFVLDENISAIKRSVAFNHYVAKRIEEEKPDVIIIGIDEGIMPINKILHNNFGETAFVISNGIAIDYSIVGVYFDEDISEEFIDYLDKCITYKYNSELLAVCVSNTAYEPTAESFGRKVKYYHLDTECIYKKDFSTQYSTIYCNVYQLDKMKEMADKSYKLFSQNVDVVM